MFRFKGLSYNNKRENYLTKQLDNTLVVANIFNKRKSQKQLKLSFIEVGK